VFISATRISQKWDPAHAGAFIRRPNCQDPIIPLSIGSLKQFRPAKEKLCVGEINQKGGCGEIHQSPSPRGGQAPALHAGGGILDPPANFQSYPCWAMVQDVI